MLSTDARLRIRILLAKFISCHCGSLSFEHIDFSLAFWYTQFLSVSCHLHLQFPHLKCSLSPLPDEQLLIILVSVSSVKLSPITVTKSDPILLLFLYVLLAPFWGSNDLYCH